jgi:3-oxoacyl-[acyl-carrier protein] reductase
MANATLLRRLPTLDDVATIAAFMASDEASVMTGTVVKLNCGSRVD